MSDHSKRIHALVHGRVQGVFFRETTCRQAKRLGLSGWVRNLANGTVETEFQGDRQAVDSLLDWLAQGSPLSSVDKVESHETDPVEDELGFAITW